MRGRQSGDQQTVVSPGNRAGDGARGVTTEAVGHEPFLAKQFPGVVALGVGKINPTRELLHGSQWEQAEGRARAPPGREYTSSPPPIRGEACHIRRSGDLPWTKAP